MYAKHGKSVQFQITNRASSGRSALQTISLRWDRAYGSLKEVRFGRSTIWIGSEAPESASISSLGEVLSNGVTKRLSFQFASNGRRGSVSFTATFSDGCTVAWPPSPPPASAKDTDGDSFGRRDSFGRPWFRDEIEVFLGTDPFQACASTGSQDSWPPDLNQDGKVNSRDVFRFLDRLASSPSHPHYSARLDFNADGAVNLADMDILKRFFLESCKHKTSFPSTRI